VARPTKPDPDYLPIRKNLSKKIRFEIFKRDNFTCQYCGKKPPETELEIDHIIPIANCGTSETLNLITSCHDCNNGKRNIPLSDVDIINKQNFEIKKLRIERKDIEKEIKEREILQGNNEYALCYVSNYWTMNTGYELTNNGRQILKGWIKKYGLGTILDKIDDITKDPCNSIEKMFACIGIYCEADKRIDKEPYLKDLWYIRKIILNRNLGREKPWQILKDLKNALLIFEINIESLKEFAKKSRNYDEFCESIITMYIMGFFDKYKDILTEDFIIQILVWSKNRIPDIATASEIKSKFIDWERRYKKCHEI